MSTALLQSANKPPLQIPVSMNLATVGRKNSLLTGKLHQNQAEAGTIICSPDHPSVCECWTQSIETRL